MCEDDINIELSLRIPRCQLYATKKTDYNVGLIREANKTWPRESPAVPRATHGPSKLPKILSIFLGLTWRVPWRRGRTRPTTTFIRRHRSGYQDGWEPRPDPAAARSGLERPSWAVELRPGGQDNPEAQVGVLVGRQSGGAIGNPAFIGVAVPTTAAKHTVRARRRATWVMAW